MVQCVNKVLEKAEQSEDGVGLGRKNRADKGMYSYHTTFSTMSADRVYKAEVEDGDITLTHYGTPIVTIKNFNDPVISHRKAEIHGGAYSASDQAAINTALSRYGIHGRARRSEGEIWLETPEDSEVRG